MIVEREMRPVDVAHAALLEAGRPDLAGIIVWVDDELGGYIEVNESILYRSDWEIVDRAETLARRFVGLAPYPRDAS